MKLEVNVSKKTAIPIIAAIIIVAGIFSVFAFNTNNPQVMGHSASELAPPTGCSANQVLSWTGSAWTCSAPSSSGLGPTVACTKVWTPPFGGPGAIQYNTIPVPAICKESQECILMAHNEVWSGAVLYRQIAGATGANPNNPRVWYIAGSSNTGGINGDSSSGTILSVVTSNTLNLYDDYFNPGTYQETSPDTWTITNGPGAMNTGTDGLWACS